MIYHRSVLLIVCRKSQLAIEYCYRVQATAQDTAVLWIHASSAARYDQDLRQLALDLGIPGSDDARVNVPQLVYNWLRESRNGTWLMVLDNADDATFLTERKGGLRSRLGFLPVCPHGSIIVTSRSRKAALELVDDADIVTLERMEDGPALALLERKLGDRTDATRSKALAAVLDCIPLALAQAAAYINAAWPMCSVEQYLEELKTSEKSKASLLKTVSKERRRDEDALDSIILTWQISFEHILRVRPSAANLLSLMSFYDHQGIPKSLLTIRLESENTEAPGENNIDSDPSTSDEPDLYLTVNDLDNDIIALRDYSLISITTPSSFEMHRLVQFAARVWLESDARYQKWAEQSIVNLDMALPTGEHEHWEQCQLLYPHARSSLEIRLTDREALLRRSSVLYKAAWFACRHGSASDAETLTTMSLHVRKRELGLEDERTLSSQGLLGLVLRQMGKYERAEDYLRRALEGMEKVLGKEHPDTLTGVNNLATELNNQGDYGAAEEYHQRALEGREKVLGREHPDTLTSVGNLAIVLNDQGKHGMAEAYYRKALEGMEKALGKEHPNILISVNNLATVLYDQGKYGAAEEHYRQALEGKEKVLGKEHPSTLASVNNLAAVLRDQGKYKAAEEYCRWALEGFEKVLGKDHPSTLISVNNLVEVLREQGKDEAALAVEDDYR